MRAQILRAAENRFDKQYQSADLPTLCAAWKRAEEVIKRTKHADIERLVALAKQQAIQGHANQRFNITDLSEHLEETGS